MGFLRRFGVRSHILLTVIGAVAIGFALVFLIVAPLVEQGARQEQLERDRWMLRAVAADVADARTTAELEARLARWQAAVEGSVCIAALDAVGRPLGAGRQRLASCLDEAGVARLADEAERRMLDGPDGEPALVVFTPAPGAAASVASRLVLAASTAEAVRRGRVTRTLVLLFMLLALGLVSVVGYLVLTQLISRPMRRTMRAIERTTQGDLDARAPVSGGRELRVLAEAFNRLTQKLQEDETRINHQISELKLINERLESATEGLIRSEKLASVGKLAAGVAHEIGNPIAIVLGYLEMLDRSDVTEEERRQFIGQATEATQRISGIIQDLLHFSRPQEGEDEPRVDVAVAVQQCLSLIRPQPRFRHVEVEVELPGEPLVAAIPERRLEQVLLNLLLNAADAMSGEEEGRIRLTATRGGERALIHVEDSGPGLSTSVRRQMFDPFFTTKEPGSGTGLGLSICYSIINTYGGDIRGDNREEGGARLTLELPLAA